MKRKLKSGSIVAVRYGRHKKREDEGWVKQNMVAILSAYCNDDNGKCPFHLFLFVP